MKQVCLSNAAIMCYLCVLVVKVMTSPPGYAQDTVKGNDSLHIASVPIAVLMLWLQQRVACSF